MGEIPLRSSNTFYYHLFNGQICRTVKAGTESARQRTNKNGEEVFEVFVGGLEGMLVGIEKRSFEIAGSTEYSWNFTIDDGEKRCVLGIPENSQIARQLISRLPNVDLNKPVAITTGSGHDTEKDKEFQWCNVHQGKDKIPTNFTKENPNGMPPLVAIKYKGKDAWDNSDQLAFFDKLIHEDIIPKIKAVAETFASNPDDLSDEPVNIRTKDVETAIDRAEGTDAPPVNDAPPPETNDLPWD